MSPSFCLPPFLHHISGVFFGGSKKEMAWINAFSVVASVTNAKPFWNGSVIKLPNEAVKEHFFPLKSLNLKVASCVCLMRDRNMASLFCRDPDYRSFIYSFHGRR
jgi:hypothetical protein